jgi:hypothetical protein
MTSSQPCYVTSKGKMIVNVEFGKVWQRNVVADVLMYYSIACLWGTEGNHRIFQLGNLDCKTVIIGYLGMIFNCRTLLCYMYVILTIPSIPLYSIEGIFILTHDMFGSYFWVIFMWYTNLKMNRLNCHVAQSNRTWWIPCS